MGELRYMISEAAKQVDVETHVLRYWEEELDLKIDRTEMGHRYYTKEDIELFQCVKKLKEKGMQLKDLKPVIPDLLEKKARLRNAAGQRGCKDKENSSQDLSQTTHKQMLVNSEEKSSEVAMAKQETEVFTDEKLEQVKHFLSDVVTEVLLDNNEKLKREIAESVTGEVVAEMDELMRVRELREEEHFRKMDCLIRQQQTFRKEAGKGNAIHRLKQIVMGT